MVLLSVEDQAGGQVLAGWLRQASDRRSTGRGRRQARRGGGSGGVRFAFYGRLSTARFQHQESSRAWQREAAGEVVAGHGAIAVEYFDVGCSRRLRWSLRPRAAALLAAVADPDRTFDSIVVGEYERAFCGDQLTGLMSLLRRHGVGLWLPELGGPVDFADPAHRMVVAWLGAQSQREVARARFRVLAAMRAQVREQGRYLGGRPPYGSRLVDVGPHPNSAHAGWGWRLQGLAPDPATAPWVRWMFAQRLAGCSVAGVARELNERGVPCPSGADPGRNRHRSGVGWRVRTVASILANPRYTGWQVWNRQ
jgi:site-specific DNA recombinase